MMPLCTSAMWPDTAVSVPGPALKWGCALCTAGAPCVAQRVCAIPVVASSFSAATAASSSETREVLRARFRPPPWCTATPQLS